MDCKRHRLERSGQAGRMRTVLAAWVLLLAAVVAAIELWPEADEAPGPRWRVWKSEVHRPSQVAGLSYELAPGIERDLGGWSVRTNARGLRDGEPVEGSDVFRVAALGGSFTFGWGVDGNQIWTALLERELWRSILVMGRDVDFLGLAVAGYSLAQQAAALAARGLEPAPWIVVLEHSLADPLAPQVRVLSAASPARRSRLMGWLAGRGAPAAEPSLEALHDPQGEPWKELSAALARVRELCAARGIPRVLLIVPRTGPQPWERYPYRELHTQVAREAARHGCDVLDLLDRFEREPPGSLVLGPDDPAPNARAQEIAADAVKRFLWESGVLTRVLESH